MRIALGAFLGAGIGFGVGYFGKCTSGLCPLTSDPLVSALIGALIGALIAIKK